MFLPGQAGLAPISVIAMREIVVMLQEHPDWRLRIEAHTDSTGTKAANLAVSQRRASLVTTWLMGRGIKRARLDPVGAGDEKPVADNDTDAGRARNRRIELVKIDSASSTDKVPQH
jgi:OOP family OmpA-OmpF porin